MAASATRLAGDGRDKIVNALILSDQCVEAHHSAIGRSAKKDEEQRRLDPCSVAKASRASDVPGCTDSGRGGDGEGGAGHHPLGQGDEGASGGVAKLHANVALLTIRAAGKASADGKMRCEGGSKTLHDCRPSFGGALDNGKRESCKRVPQANSPLTQAARR